MENESKRDAVSQAAHVLINIVIILLIVGWIVFLSALFFNAVGVKVMLLLLTTTVVVAIFSKTVRGVFERILRAGRIFFMIEK